MKRIQAEENLINKDLPFPLLLLLLLLFSVTVSLEWFHSCYSLYHLKNE